MLPLPPSSTLFPYTTLFRSGVQKHSDRSGRRNRLAQQPETLRLHSRNEIVYSCYVTARAVETGHHAVLDGIIAGGEEDRKSTRLNSSHLGSSYAVFCLKKKK